MAMSDLNTLAQLEALLFFHGEPVTLSRIASVLKVKEKQVEELVRALQEKMEGDEERGLSVFLEGGKVQMLTKPAFGALFEALVKDELKEELAPAALETLAIVAYVGPLSRAEVDYLRGVNSSFTMRSLVMRGLVERVSGSRKGVMYEYKPTIGCLAHLGVGRIEELPEHGKYHGLLERLRSRDEVASDT